MQCANLQKVGTIDRI